MFNVLLAGFPKRPALLAAARRAPALAPQQVRLPPAIAFGATRKTFKAFLPDGLSSFWHFLYSTSLNLLRRVFSPNAPCLLAGARVPSILLQGGGRLSSKYIFSAFLTADHIKHLTVQVLWYWFSSTMLYGEMLCV